MNLVQRSFRQAVASAVGAIILDTGIETPWRLLRAFFILAEPGDNGVVPIIRHRGSGGQILGEWTVAASDGLGFPPATQVRVTVSTAVGFAGGMLAPGNPSQPASAKLASICIPSDLVILENETLELELAGANDGSGGYTVATEFGSEIFFTAALEV